MTKPDDEFERRVKPAFAVIDAILHGTLLPEPSIAEQEALGLADYDPELRYRVARDTLEQYYGKPKQQMEIEGSGWAPTLVFPGWAQPQELPPPTAEQAGPATPLLESGDEDDAPSQES